jgi:hypothetical protein
MRTIIVNTDGPRGPKGPAGPQSTGTINQLLVTTTSSFSTSDLLNNESQNGKHVVINNGSSNIFITCSGEINSFYQKLGTGNITFVAGSGRTLTTTAGSAIGTQYGGASLSFSGSNDILVLSNTGFFFDGSSEVRKGNYQLAQEISEPLTLLNSSSGEFLKIKSNNYIARTQDRWFDIGLNATNLSGSTSDYTFKARRIVPGYSDLAIGLEFTSSTDDIFLQVDTRQPLSNGVVPGTKTMALEVEALKNNEYVDSVIYQFVVEPTGSYTSGSIIPLITDSYISASSCPTSSVVFGIPFGKGKLWDENKVTLQYVGGNPLEYQREVTGNWISSGSIQWVQFRTVLPSGSQVEAVIDGPHQPTTGSALVIDGEGLNEFEMTAGDYTFVLAKEHSPIKSIKSGSIVIADSTNARGLYLNVSNNAPTASGQLAQSSTDVDITVESTGPCSSCVKIEGDYITSGGTRVAKHITRLESHKGIDGVNISHTLIISQSTNDIWFDEMGWELTTHPSSPTSVTALFNIESGSQNDTTQANIESVHEISLSTLTTASILQNSFPTSFGRTNIKPQFSIFENGVLTESHLTASIGDWFGYKSDNNGLIWGIKDAARQCPKEVSITRDKLNLLMFSSASGDEIDFRTSTLYTRWNGDSILPYNGTTSSSFAAAKSDAVGWSKTTDLLLLPTPSTPNTSSIAAEVSKLQYPYYGFVDPTWLHDSDAMGPLHPYDSASFELAEKFIDGTISPYYEGVPGNRYNTFFDYYTGPAYFYTGRYRLSYTLLHDAWLLAARNGERTDVLRRNVRKFAENTTRAFRDSYVCHIDEPSGTSNRKLKGAFIEANAPHYNFPWYWETTSAFNLSTTTSLLKFIWDYHIAGNRRSRDVALDYGNAVKNHLDPDVEVFRALPTLKTIAHAYQFSGDYDLYLKLQQFKNGANSTGPLIYDPDTELFISKNKAYDSTTYKVNTDVGAIIDAWEVTGIDVFKQMALRAAKLFKDQKMGMNPIVRISGKYDIFLFNNTNLLSQGQIIDFSFRGKNIKYDTNDGETDAVGFSSLDTTLGGMPYQMSIVSQLSASSKPISSFVAFKDYQNTNPIFVKKGNNSPGIQTYIQVSSDITEDSDDDDDNITEATSGGSISFKILKDPDTPSNRLAFGNAPIPISKDGVNPNSAISLKISKDLGSPVTDAGIEENFVYKIQPGSRGDQFVVTDTTASIVFRNDDYFMPKYVRPAYKFFFGVTSSISPSIFTEYAHYIYDPTGSIYTGNPLSGTIDLSGQMTGNWAAEPIGFPSLISSSGMPPFFAINSGSFWFDPLKTLNATTSDSVNDDIKVNPPYYPNLGAQTGSLVSGSLAGGGSGTLRISSASGDIELFSNISGTLEFYLKTDGWDFFNMKDDPTVQYDATPYPEYRKFLMQVATRTDGTPPPTNDFTGNRNWSLNYYLDPHGTTINLGPTDPSHSLYGIAQYWNDTGSGASAVQKRIWGTNSLIKQDKWHHIAMTWEKNNAPSVFFNGAKHSATAASSGQYLRINPSFINFPELLKAYIRHLRVSTKVIYTTSFTPPQGETPYGFTSGSTLFYMPLSGSGDTSYIASGSKTINVTYV